MEKKLDIKECEDRRGKIKILDVDVVKVVKKPWGWEKWIADGYPEFPYALKEIFIKAPYRSSVQFHRNKQETNYIQKGKGLLYYSRMTIDVNKFVKGGYTQPEINRFVSDLASEELSPGKIFHIYPGFIHRVEALEDLLMIETSSIELDDVFRLQDDTGREHGRIMGEHK